MTSLDSSFYKNQFELISYKNTQYNRYINIGKSKDDCTSAYKSRRTVSIKFDLLSRYLSIVICNFLFSLGTQGMLQKFISLYEVIL